MNFLARVCWTVTIIFAAAGLARAIPILILTESNQLVRIETTTPQFIQNRITVRGLQAAEKLLGIDFRPATGQLYGITSGNRLYVINPSTGVATQIGSGPLPLGFDLVGDQGFDFDPVADQIRLVTGAKANLRINPTNAAVTFDTPAAFAAGDPNVARTPTITAAAYSNNFGGATLTTLYAIVIGRAQDTTVPTLLTTLGSSNGSISPDSGQLFTVGNMGFLFLAPTGLDIGPDGVAYALLNGTDTVNKLDTVNLATGALTRIEITGTSGDLFSDLAVIPPNSIPPTGTIQFDLSNYSAAEGAGSATLTVARSGDTTGTVSVDFASSDNTARQRSDYIIGSGRLLFGPGETSRTLKILIIDDAYVETPESFNVYLVNATEGFVPASPNPATVTIVDNDSGPVVTNPIDEASFFVRQHYLDFLNREADPGGLAYWTNQINTCGFVLCANRRRTGVSAAFYFSTEFQDTGYFVIRLYQVGFARQPNYHEFTMERNRIIVDSNLEANRAVFVDEFMRSPEFTVRHPDTQTPERYVDDLNSAGESPLTQSERDALVAGLLNGSQTRTTVLRAIVDNATLKQQFFNRGFVLMQYFGYLRRDPDFGGFHFWLNILDQTNNFRSMVCAFITSPEYQQRFSTVQNHCNQECGQ